MARKQTNCIGHCGRETNDSSKWYQVFLPNRGEKPAYLCPHCAMRKDNYTDKNNVWRGKRCGGGFSYSIELECMDYDATMQAYMLDNYYLPTYDCTVAIEYKSPIFNNLNSLKKTAATLESFEGIHTIISGSNNTGTHFNVGHEAYNNRAWYDVCENYLALFNPLSNLLDSNPHICNAIFGRRLGGWASALDAFDAYEHRNFINLEHNTHIEFRVCKFQSSAQYRHAAKTCKDIMQCIIDYTSGKYTAEKTGTRIVHMVKRNFNAIKYRVTW